MLILHQANRMEALLDQLVALTATPLAQVFQAETILVQSQGMARWLALTLARRRGIAANQDSPFPAAFIWRLLAGGVGRQEASPYEPEVLRWSLVELLSEKADQPGFGQVAAYLRQEGGDLRRYQLAGRLAELFDQYLIHRPEWIEAWSAGQDDHWQAKLWRALIERHGDRHRVALLREFAAGFDAAAARDLGLAERISLFGIPALPASQLHLFATLAEVIDVHFFLLSPSGQFWCDLASRRDLARTALRHGGLDPSRDLHLDEGCPLLMGLGALGRQFQALLQGWDVQPGLEHYADPGLSTVLAMVQSDLNAALRQPALPLDGCPALADGSLRVHACHSPLREVEVLHDQLLDLLATHPELEADDILIMVPEIERYAPLIEAVLSDPAEEGTRLPFAIADRPVLGPLTRAFLDLLALLDSRATLRQVLAFLEQGPVRGRLAIDDEEMALIRSWLTTVGVTWGLSAEHRGRFGVDEPIGTWQAGIDRLLLGLLTPGDGRHFLHGLLPADLLEAGQGETLAKLIAFVEALAGLVHAGQSRHRLGRWHELLAEALARFFSADEAYYADCQAIRAALDALARAADLGQCRQPLPLAVVSAALEQGLSRPMGTFLAGGRITVCQLVPMRSIPFKVICLLGMNGTVFPRQERRPGFDLMAASPRPGDRNRRDDDRYLFLETILSAREVLYLSYVGMNADNSPMPPSVVVSELIDHIASRLGREPVEVTAELVVRHPLQPFSRRYFAGQLFSYSRQQQAIAAALAGGQAFAGLFGEGASLAKEAVTSVELDDLIRFFEHPVRFLLRTRLGLSLEEWDEAVAERERFSLDALEGYRLTADLTRGELGEAAGEDLCPVAQVTGQVSPGLAGRCQYEASRKPAVALAAALRSLRGPAPLPDQDVRCQIGAVTLSGTLRDLWPTGQYLYRPSSVKRMNHADLIRAWIRHLVLSLLCPAEGWPTIYVFRDGLFRFDFFPAAEATLASLVDLYLTGQQRPLPLLPKSSYAYAKKRWTGKGGTPDEALVVAQASWQEGEQFDNPECQEPYLATVYGDRQPVLIAGPEGFVALAEEVLAPAMQWGRKG